MPGFTMNRQYIFWLHDVVAVQSLTFRVVAGDMHLCVALVNYIRAKYHQAVDNAGNGVLIAWDQLGCKNNQVVRLNSNLAMFLVGHPRKSRHGLTLGTG